MDLHSDGGGGGVYIVANYAAALKAMSKCSQAGEEYDLKKQPS